MYLGKKSFQSNNYKDKLSKRKIKKKRPQKEY